jgi:hypothetical protein
VDKSRYFPEIRLQEPSLRHARDSTQGIPEFKSRVLQLHHPTLFITLSLTQFSFLSLPL